jgi:protein-S-isoprenylcysteine O-methyltransferase Ste14
MRRTIAAAMPSVALRLSLMWKVPCAGGSAARVHAAAHCIIFRRTRRVVYDVNPIRYQARATHMLELFLVCAAELLFGTAPRIALLDTRYLPALLPLVGLGMALTAAGVAFCIVARLYLGQNWSATATINQDHELIRTGPYGFVRHPIYTGTLIAVVGTTMAFGEIRDLLALPLAVMGFWLKARAEERLLMSNFGARYAAYRREAHGAIIPYVL